MSLTEIETLTLESNHEQEEARNMSPSYHHGFVCSNVIAALKAIGKFTIFSELSLFIANKEYIPDICVYPKRTIDLAADDIIRMVEMPLAVMEVLSPRQTILDIQEKFPVYLNAGVKSCWLVIPPVQTITVYAAPGQGKVFKTGDVTDPMLDIQIPLEAFFV
jgi:Uma2 family endonuclease